MPVNHIFFCPTSDTLCPALQLAAKHGHFKTVEHLEIVELLLAKGSIKIYVRWTYKYFEVK